MKDLHSLLGHVGKISVIDTLGTVVISTAIAKKLKWPVNKTIVGALVVGELTHLIFKVNTPVADLINKP